MKKKKLTLNRESLRALTTSALGNVAGAMIDIGTRTCIASLCGSCVNDSCDDARTMYISICPCGSP